MGPVNSPKGRGTCYAEAQRTFDILKIHKRVTNRLRREVYKFWSQAFPDDGFLKKVPGVIHVGAHSGQERERYASRALNVIWVEPIPTVFEALQANIAGIPKQRAYRQLLAAQHGTEYDFHVSSNIGASSSIFELAKHADIWPGVRYTHDIRMVATTLTHLVGAEQINLDEYGALVLDTQGSELLVLKGALDILDRFQFVKTEAADFEIYAGCCQMKDLTEFLRQQGFSLQRKTPFARRDGGGTCYDLVYGRV
jgi:FkbM family methyltransferase